MGRKGSGRRPGLHFCCERPRKRHALVCFQGGFAAKTNRHNLPVAAGATVTLSVCPAPSALCSAFSLLTTVASFSPPSHSRSRSHVMEGKLRLGESLTRSHRAGGSRARPAELFLAEDAVSLHLVSTLVMSSSQDDGPAHPHSPPCAS